MIDITLMSVKSTSKEHTLYDKHLHIVNHMLFLYWHVDFVIFKKNNLRILLCSLYAKLTPAFSLLFKAIDTSMVNIFSSNSLELKQMSVFPHMPNRLFKIHLIVETNPSFKSIRLFKVQ